MRRLRQTLARHPSAGDADGPENSVRVAVFYLLVDLLRLLDELKRRVDSGQRCRLVVVKRSDESGRFSTEIAIELKQQ